MGGAAASHGGDDRMRVEVKQTKRQMRKSLAWFCIVSRFYTGFVKGTVLPQIKVISCFPKLNLILALTCSIR